MSNLQQANATPEGVLTATGSGDVTTPLFYRHDVGTAPGRLHEPSGDSEGNLWTSPLDGTLWRYHTPTGALEILDLSELTGFEWRGRHMWPVAAGEELYLCCPDLAELWVLDTGTRQARSCALGHSSPQVFGGFAAADGATLYLYDIGAPGVFVWDTDAHRGELYPCPYTLSAQLYMYLVDEERKEIWGSTWTGNDLVRFDIEEGRWTGQWQCPLDNATTVPANALADGALWMSDQDNGRLIPFMTDSEEWGDTLSVPGHREWFGYMSGGWAFKGLLYHVHSTWLGDNESIDGKPHHFADKLTVFDPATRRFSRLDFPASADEQFMVDYLLEVGCEMFILCVDSEPPGTTGILRTSMWTGS